MWGGPEYGDSYYVALLLIIPVTVPLIQNLGIEIQRAKNKHKTRAIVYLCIAIANIFISIPLIRQFSSIGAAIGTTISLVMGNIFFINWYYYKYIGLDILTFWKNIISFFPGMILPIVVGVLIKQYIVIEDWFFFGV